MNITGTTYDSRAIYTIKDRTTGKVYKETGRHGLEVLSALEIRLGHSDLALTNIEAPVITSANMHD